METLFLVGNQGLFMDPDEILMQAASDGVIQEYAEECLAGMYGFWEALASSTTLKTLSLMLCGLRPYHLQTLAVLLREGVLETLNLSYNAVVGMDPAEGVELHHALANSTTMKKLRLSGCELRYPHAQQLSRLLRHTKKGHPGQYVTLERMRLTAGIDPKSEFVATVPEGVEVHVLEVVHLNDRIPSNLPVGIFGFIQTYKLLDPEQRREGIRSRRRVDSVGWTLLQDLTEHRWRLRPIQPNLRELSLDQNRGIGSRGWRVVTRAISSSPTLTRVSAQECDLSQSTIDEFEDAMRQNKDLRITWEGETGVRMVSVGAPQGEDVLHFGTGLPNNVPDFLFTHSPIARPRRVPRRMRWKNKRGYDGKTRWNKKGVPTRGCTRGPLGWKKKSRRRRRLLPKFLPPHRFREMVAGFRDWVANGMPRM